MFAFAAIENDFLGPTKFENKKIKNLLKDEVAIYTTDLQNRKVTFQRNNYQNVFSICEHNELI